MRAGRAGVVLYCLVASFSHLTELQWVLLVLIFRQHKSQDGRMHGDHQYLISEGPGRRLELRSGGVEISGRRFE